jgi:hypothetical protein
MSMELTAKSIRTKAIGRGLFPLWVLQLNDGFFVQKELFGLVPPGTFFEIKYTAEENRAHTWKDVTTMMEWAKNKGYKVNQANR